MEYLVGFLIVGAIVYWVFRSLARGYAQAAAASDERDRKYDLQNFRIYVEHEPVRVVWTFDFEAMRAVLDVTTVDGPGVDRETTYMVRRKGQDWSMKLTQKSWEVLYEDALRSSKDKTSRLARSTGKERLEALGQSPTWQPMNDELEPQVENAYQRYLRHG